MLKNKSLLTSLPLILSLSSPTIAGCSTHNFTTCDDGIVHWFDPNTGEICDPHDCGGGRAAPRRDVPGCPMYTGTESYITSPSYLSCWTPPSSASTTVARSGVQATPTLTDAVITATKLNISGSGSEPSKTEGSISETITGEESTATPETTTAPSVQSISTTAEVSGGEATGNESASGSAASTTATNNAGILRDGSFVAVAGAVVGALALV
ncbi:hypothetical protein PHISCL_00848 [Aspergillus sclerotialis]|uniref:Siderophore biosynthesis enzyme n=1 Tax=Aspergillus sclerotialis TaxID=2070753 RepID=A0A3A2ZWV1_9EURO|nr:hypothetical protein PHISCL_00848 [Aspergillus sclerotialis]